MIEHLQKRHFAFFGLKIKVGEPNTANEINFLEKTRITTSILRQFPIMLSQMWFHCLILGTLPIAEAEFSLSILWGLQRWPGSGKQADLTFTCLFFCIQKHTQQLQLISFCTLSLRLSIESQLCSWACRRAYGAAGAKLRPPPFLVCRS